jgi:hypothetical protein
MSNSDGAKSMKPGVGLLTKGNIGFGVIDAGMNMAAGDDAFTAVGKAAVSTALWYTAPGIMTAHLAATTVPSMVGAGVQWHKKQKAGWNQAHLQGMVGGNFQDSQRALTMRQAAVQAIQGSKMNARSALGGEARILSNNWNRM